MRARLTSSFHRSGGFTLLEILLVITLLALLIAGAYSGLTASVKAMRSGEAAIERVDKVRTVQEFLRHQIMRILPMPYATSRDGTNGYMFEGDGHFMRFVAPMPGYLSHGGEYVQTLELTSGQGGQQLVFTSQLLNGFEAKKRVDDEVSTVVLLDHIRDGQFAYRSVDTQGNLLKWTQNWQDSTTTPLMINIDLSLDRGQLGWSAMTIPLMIDTTAKKGQGGGTRK